MKARIKATGEIVEAMYSHTAKDKGYDIIWYITPQGASFSKEELEFIDTGESLDYWTRLEHQYAGMAMQGILSNPSITERELTTRKGIIEDAERLAHALVEKLKEKEEK
jgi:hypothetical protein